MLDDSLPYELELPAARSSLVTDDRFRAQRRRFAGGSYDYAYPYSRGSTPDGTDFGALCSRATARQRGQASSPSARRGNLIASLDTQRDVLDISAAGKYLAVLYSDELVIYTSDLPSTPRSPTRSTRAAVRMRADGSAVCRLAARLALCAVIRKMFHLKGK